MESKGMNTEENTTPEQKPADTKVEVPVTTVTTTTVVTPQTAPEATEAPKRRGRPKGSKNKPTVAKKVGRPAKAKTVKGKRGRPAGTGSQNTQLLKLVRAELKGNQDKMLKVVIKRIVAALKK
jgi:hypothetical protein